LWTSWRRKRKSAAPRISEETANFALPTVNGAVYFDDRFVGNPLVYCGNVGLLPVDKVHKRPVEGECLDAG
jgi:phosphoribosylformylglycinamidine synthase